MSSSESTVSEQIIGELQRGAVPAELVGTYARSSVYMAFKKWKRRGDSNLTSTHDKNADERPKSERTTVTLNRLSVLLYEWTVAQYPQYTGSLEEWVEDVIKGYCTDHAEQLRLRELCGTEQPTDCSSPL